MTARSVILTSAAAALVAAAVPAHAGSTGPACRHLVVGSTAEADHFGNHGPYPSAVDSPGQVTLRWAELRTTRTTLVATLEMKRLSAEQSTLDHGYSVTFRTGGRSIQLMAMFGQLSSWARASASVTGDQPSDGGAYMGTALGPISATRDLRRNLITLTADLDLIGVGHEALTGIGAQTWAGVAYGAGGTYGMADHASTTRSYRPGSPDCLSP